MQKSVPQKFGIPFFLAPALLAFSTASATLPAGYPGYPYAGVQPIPGRVFLANFDQGPKDGTWHDYEAKNPWACKIRDSTGVGLQIMGAGGDAGDTKEADSLVKARTQIKACYLAETNMGDWTKYSVRISQAGKYNLAFLSAAAQTQIPFVAVSILNDKDSVGSGKLTLPITTYFHHWVYTRNVANLQLDTGLQVLRFDIPGNGPMNIDYIDFEYAGAAEIRSAAAPSEARGSFAIKGLREDAGVIRFKVASASNEPISVKLYDVSGIELASTNIEKPFVAENTLVIEHFSMRSRLVILRATQGKSTVEERFISLNR